MSPLVKQRHGDGLEVEAITDAWRIEHAAIHAPEKDCNHDIPDRAPAAADIGDAGGVQPANLPVGNQRLNPKPAMPHDVGPHDRCELGTWIISRIHHCLLTYPLQFDLGRGDDVMQQLVLRLEVVVERTLRQPAGLHDVAHGDNRIAAFGELLECRGTDRLDRWQLLALGSGHRNRQARRLALAHIDPPTMSSTIFQPSSAAGRTSFPESAARTFAAVPSRARA